MGPARPRADLHVARRETEFDHADANSTADAVNERFQQDRENLKAVLAIHFAYYNFCRVHQTLRVTPAMEAGISDHVWNVGELMA